MLSHGAKHCQNAPCSAGTLCCCQPSRDSPRRSSGYRSRMKLSLSPPVPILVRSARRHGPTHKHGAKSVIKLTLSCVELHEDGEPGIERGAPAVGTGGDTHDSVSLTAGAPHDSRGASGLTQGCARCLHTSAARLYRTGLCYTNSWHLHSPPAHKSPEGKQFRCCGAVGAHRSRRVLSCLGSYLHSRTAESRMSCCAECTSSCP